VQDALHYGDTRHLSSFRTMCLILLEQLGVDPSLCVVVVHSRETRKPYLYTLWSSVWFIYLN